MNESHRMKQLAGVLEEARLTMATVNKAAKKYGYELVKGRGYMYWDSLDYMKYPDFDESSAGVYKLSDIPTVEEWIGDLKMRIKDNNRWR